MDNTSRFKEHETVKDLLGEAAHKAQGEASVVVQLDKLV